MNINKNKNKNKNKNSNEISSETMLLSVGDKIGNVYIWDVNEYFGENENEYYLNKQRLKSKNLNVNTKANSNHKVFEIKKKLKKQRKNKFDDALSASDSSTNSDNNENDDDIDIDIDSNKYGTNERQINEQNKNNGLSNVDENYYFRPVIQSEYKPAIIKISNCNQPVRCVSFNNQGNILIAVTDQSSIFRFDTDR